MKLKSLLAIAIGSTLAATAMAHETHAPQGATVVVKIEQLDPVNGNRDAGTVTISESPYGLVFTPDLHGLAAGVHGFHIHQNPSCDPKEKDGKLTAGLAAGGHWDPKEAKKHGYPWQDDAHLGDLPALIVLADGTATNPVLAPRIKSLTEVVGHSMMIHEGGDNHSDHPKPLGGGGARMACGVIK
ncbi:superoxide dismutase [Cu-Zn] SodC [uncultured Haemophilus sp.]|uniref:superoxide dismutase [Cu-Zn] SodC n=1 Tax=uncultured Haemophilus sp. TaxID=237779 RepID=UPI002806587F|nr:superoxide dismutase [Cu-Zn] SodC [uncultured Haemophilus sp.]